MVNDRLATATKSRIARIAFVSQQMRIQQPFVRSRDDHTISVDEETHVSGVREIRDQQADLSPRLYNQDLAPTQRAGRKWRSYNIFTLWANDVHSLGNYAFAISLFALGLGAWQILLAFLIGALL